MCRRAILLLSVFLCRQPVVNAQSEIWTGLTKGKYHVGFRATVGLDYAQNYPYFIDSGNGLKKFPKPLLINVWYPATAGTQKRMTTQAYLQFNSDDKNVAAWIARYKEYTEKTITGEVFSDKWRQDSVEKRLVQAFFDTETISVRNAPAAAGKFPVIIYHQGAGASIEDNAILCELLASHGYVVIGCSFQSADGEKLAAHGLDDSVKDLAFILTMVKQMPQADWQHIGMVGHSLGAQTLNHIAVQGNLPVDALVMLESTQEYFIGANGMWPFVAFVKENAEKAKAALLFASNPHAVHDLADKMVNADRYYLTIPEVGHNDFISQGIQKKLFLYKKTGTDASKNNFESANGQYNRLCRYILAFFNARLKNDAGGWKSLKPDAAAVCGYGDYLEEMPRGTSKTMYAFTSKKPPTPRELKFLIAERKIDTVVQLLKAFWTKASKHPVYHADFIYAMTDHLLASDTSSAGTLYRAYSDLLGAEQARRRFVAFGRIFVYFGEKDEARKIFEKLITLDPRKEEEVRKLMEQYIK